MQERTGSRPGLCSTQVLVCREQHQLCSSDSRSQVQARARLERNSAEALLG